MDNITSSKEENAILLGNKIKEKRLEKNISIEQLAEKFKVSVEMLNDIENGIIVTSQNSYFSRLLCKKFINEIGLDVNEFNFIINEVYQNDHDDFTKTINYNPKDIHFDDDIKKRQAKKNIYSIIKYVSITIFLTVLIITLLYFFASNFKNVSNDVVNETTLLESTTLVPKEIINPKPVTEVVFKKDDSKNNTYSINALTDANKYKLKIEFTGDCYALVYDYDTQVDLTDGKVYKGGEILEVDVLNKKDIQINFGAIQNATIYVDDFDINLKEQDLVGQKVINILNEIK